MLDLSPRLISELVDVRRDLHAHPETAYREQRTAAKVAGWLLDCGLEVHEGIGRTGVVGVLRRSAGPAIMLRADMDALPIQEENTFAHCSTHSGQMHACGHDGHTAMLLGAARVLAADDTLRGTLVFVFQPAEESEAGARTMVEEGLFERFPVDAVFGLHNWPGLAVGAMAVHDGPVMAGTDAFRIRLTGHGAHAAMPHLGRDVIVAGAALVQALQGVVSRRTAPVDAAVVSVTVFRAGDVTNVLPETAELRGTVRTLRPAVRQQVLADIERVLAGTAAAHAVEAVLDWTEGYPPTINTRNEAGYCRQAALDAPGVTQVIHDLPPTMGAEDFAFFLQQRPGCYVWLGNGPGEGGCTLHNPRYDFNDAVIPVGVAYWVSLARQRLGSEPGEGE